MAEAERRQPNAGVSPKDAPASMGVRIEDVERDGVAAYLTELAADLKAQVYRQQKRKLVEQVFGWMKTIGGLRKRRHRGGPRVEWMVTFAAATYNLVRPPHPAGRDMMPPPITTVPRTNGRVTHRSALLGSLRTMSKRRFSASC